MNFDDHLYRDREPRHRRWWAVAFCLGTAMAGFALTAMWLLERDAVAGLGL